MSGGLRPPPAGAFGPPFRSSSDPDRSRTLQTELILRDAPLDDESLTPEGAAAMAEGYAAIARGDLVTAEELRRELQLALGAE